MRFFWETGMGPFRPTAVTPPLMIPNQWFRLTSTLMANWTWLFLVKTGTLKPQFTLATGMERSQAGPNIQRDAVPTTQTVRQQWLISTVMDSSTSPYETTATAAIRSHFF